MGTNDIPSAAESRSILDRLVHKRAAVQKSADEERAVIKLVLSDESAVSIRE